MRGEDFKSAAAQEHRQSAKARLQNKGVISLSKKTPLQAETLPILTDKYIGQPGAIPGEVLHSAFRGERTLDVEGRG